MNATGPLGLIGWILLCEIAGSIGSFLSFNSIGEWYANIAKPWFTPPGWVFGPVWLILYAMMGTAAWLVARRGWGTPGVKAALLLFLVQLAVNSFWTYAFFGLRNPLFGLIVIILLLGLVAADIFLFYRLSPAAGWLMVPYMLWGSFATALTAGIWQLNR